MLGIAFEGCACRAAFHAGVAAALAESGLRFDLSAGASSGSLCAAGVAADRSAELPSIFRALSGRSVVSFRRVLWNRSLFDMSHIVRSTLHSTFGVIDLRDRHTEALIVATRLRGLRKVVYSSRTEPDLIEPLLGSCFFPVLYGRPIRVRGELLIDGGLTDNLPVEILEERGAKEIIASVTSPDATALKTPMRTRWRPQVSGARLHVICPKVPLIQRSWDFSHDRMERSIDEGYARGREFCGT